MRYVCVLLYHKILCCTVWLLSLLVSNFHLFFKFLSMIIYEVLGMCLRFNICSAWSLGIRRSTFYNN